MEERLVVPCSKSHFEKLFLIIMLLAPCLLLYSFTLQNDTYWLICMGEHIVKNGFPTVDPLTFHDGLSFTVQQWLTSVIFYLLYSRFGVMALYILNIIVYFIMTAVIFRLCINISRNNLIISLAVTVFTCILLSFYIVPRPQTFSTLIFILVIYFLEKFIETDRPLYLAALPVLSVLLVNLHSAMWLFFFVLLIPYLIDGLKKDLWITRTQGYRLVPILWAALLSVAAGFINPYGIKNMLYVVYSYGNSKVNSVVNEMASPDFKEWFGITLFLLILFIVFVFMITKGHDRLRYTLITIGTLYMGLSSVRSLALFAGCAIPFLAYRLKDLKLPELDFSKGKRIIRYVLTASILVLVIFVLCIKEYDFSESMNDFRPIGAVDYIVENIDTSKMRLYNEYNTGGYIEFRGLRTFIDSRAEVFLKSLNKKDDIILDYLDVRSSKLHYRHFVEKYSFTHLLVGKGDPINVYLKEDSGYKKLYEDKMYLVYKVGDGT